MWLNARSDLWRPRLLTGALVLFGLALPSTAAASQVSVAEVLEEQYTATLTFTAAPGETNLVTIRQAPLGNELLDLEVVDGGAALTAGAGCTGGGPAGTPAHCTIHAPRWPDQLFCGKNCTRYVPGTGWTDRVAADLGDGDDSFDATAVGGPKWYESFQMRIRGGGGDDTIQTGSGGDLIEPGMGDDRVDSGPGGYNTIVAEAVPDGDDVITMGNEIEDWVSYSRRTTPLNMSGNTIGGAGESDSLTGVVELSTGSGGDLIESSSLRHLTLFTGAGDDVAGGGPGPETVFGGPGDDRISGNGGDDLLSGGAGNDFLDGGAGNDLIREREDRTEPRLPSTAPASGDDVGIGGEGDDDVELGAGADRAEGGSGNDAIWAGQDDDSLDGGAGNDTLAGEGGTDAIAGGEGDDVVKAGLLEERLRFPPRVIDSWADSIDCGPGSDEAELNRWDAAHDCERRKPLRLARFGKTKRNRARGTATMPITVAGAGKLTVRGRGIAPVSKRVGKIQKAGDVSARVTVRPRGHAARALRRDGHVRLRIWVEWEPDGGLPRAEPRKLTLLRSRAPS